MFSILTDDLEHCYVCGTSRKIHIHHIYRGRNRNNSDQDGCIVPLCIYHHTGKNGVHGSNEEAKELKEKLLKECEEKWLEVNNATKEDFLERYRINYLE